MSNNLITTERTGKSQKKERIIVIDALRGFALIGILIVHGYERFILVKNPEIYFLFNPELDAIIKDIAFFMVSSKAYSIFALMFGISFHIQMDSYKARATKPNMLFARRLVILMLFGALHTFIFVGDILFLYAVIGFLLIPINKFNTKTLWGIALVFALQIPFVVEILWSFINSDYNIFRIDPLISWRKLFDIFAEADFLEVIKTNITIGKLSIFGSNYNSGRIYQLISLFTLGLIMARYNILMNLQRHKKKILKIFLLSVLLCITLWFIIESVTNFNFEREQRRLLRIILRSYFNLSFTAGLVTLFLSIYSLIPKGKLFKHFAVFGRMSLTNYITQSIIGVFFFYGFGLGMYRYMGNTWGIVYGVMFAVLQIVFSHYWLGKYNYGPMEWLWRAITFSNFKLKLKKR